VSVCPYAFDIYSTIFVVTVIVIAVIITFMKTEVFWDATILKDEGIVVL
jgi:hypothetical protein